jgi:hypothetical protein
VPLARGWERQLDRKVNALFYDDGAFSPAAYEAWLHDNAVRYVALADAPIDYSAAAEAALVRSRPAFLREVWHDENWRVFAVVDPTPLASGGARVTRMAPDTLDLSVPRAGAYEVRVRFTPYWRVVAGAGGCVAPTDPGDDASWTTVTARAAGPLRLRAGFSLGRVRATSERCSG